jgi:hypothetical protein
MLYASREASHLKTFRDLRYPSITRLVGQRTYLENLLRLEVPITRLIGHGAYFENLSEIGGTHHKAGRLRAYIEKPSDI